MLKNQKSLVQWITMVDKLHTCALNISIPENRSFVLKALRKSDPNPDGVRIFLIYEKNSFCSARVKI
jgi:hypothetical protein